MGSGDEMGVPLAASAAALTVLYFCIPLLDSYVGVMDRLWPASLRHLYEPREDPVAGLMALGALGGYVLVAVLLCTALDMAPRLTVPLKVQGEKNYFTRGEWLQAVGLSLANMLLFSWASAVPVWQLHKHGPLRGGAPVARPEDELRWGAELANFLVHVIVIDVWFYWTHRVLHWGPLYKHIHKLHHRFKAPTAVACMYAHPLEFCFGNAMGMQLGPALTNCHPYAAAFWMSFGLISTSMSHSGYRAFGAADHDAHHEFFDYNFGAGGAMDYLFGTRFAGSEREKKVLANRAATATPACKLFKAKAGTGPKAD